MDKQKLIVIVGPTASGKSSLAVRLARKFSSEIISADSRQVYRGLTIGTGKVTSKEMAGIPHHLLDVASPGRAFTAAQFKTRAERAIRDIARRGKLPIITGGTAFWIDTLVYNLSLPEVKPNMRLRRLLEKKNPAELFRMLKGLDPRRAAHIEHENPRRLIRAIEIARALGRVPKLKRQPAYDALWIGINPSYEAGSRKIRKRVHTMIRQGLIAETQKLLRQGVSKERVREFGFEYAAALDVIIKQMPHAELAPRIIRDTMRYARRQMRWWKRNTEIRWISDPRKAMQLARSFLKKS
ncbi:MAG: tRNA (adenosine(37)-N6)-dimethylallyltransferase MiaA [Candidatus Sungbacteria bacterium]|nr:tRNA (adenosine(37)-N6)-dimethylallyltransferase MiaA [Candidatus Sungbacteria bacterium]